ncbi:MAG: HAMP domain-containing sensor histidine kinase [Burkholderiaceae bacterium]
MRTDGADPAAGAERAAGASRAAPPGPGGEDGAAGHRPFRLTRWFALASLGSIALVGFVSASLLSTFLAHRMLHRTGEVTMEFVHSLMRIHDGTRFFADGPADAERFAEIERVFLQVSRMQDVIHVNLYDPQQRLVWSTNREAIGRSFDFNPELAEALRGELAVESDILTPINYIKPEHMFLTSAKRAHAVEYYVPVFGAGGEVAGVVELYMSPRSLFEDIEQLSRRVWLSSAGASLFLFLVLLGIVRRADAVMQSQQRRLIERESMAAVGEMASAVAHGIRNPMAIIRSSAELVADDDAPGAEQARDIIRQVDRLEGWVRRLLAYAYQSQREPEPLAIEDVLGAAAASFAREFERRRVELVLEPGPGLPRVPAERDSLEHAFSNLIANAIEAMPDGGRLVLSTRLAPDGRAVVVEFTDTGVGMSEERLARLFQPFQTTKSTGLGVGTRLVKRTVERLGGSIAVRSRPGAGSTFSLTLPLKTPR